MFLYIITNIANIQQYILIKTQTFTLFFRLCAFLSFQWTNPEFGFKYKPGTLNVHVSIS